MSTKRRIVKITSSDAAVVPASEATLLCARRHPIAGAAAGVVNEPSVLRRRVHSEIRESNDSSVIVHASNEDLRTRVQSKSVEGARRLTLSVYCRHREHRH